ncbi:MAG: hypothetical protein KTR29_00525 [Rhodothermaceae bacterium]|nr:hypothetical protein [Rhodothermaceae bacterium]
MVLRSVLCVILFILLLIPQSLQAQSSDSSRSWLSGDHHIHSRYSVGWNMERNPPTPITGGDAIYHTALNALMASHYGLSWMVTTDHGGPNHSKVNRDKAYPDLQMSRIVVPEVIQFYGMEFDTPGADHSSLIIPHSHNEADHLFHIESTYNRREPFPLDETWNTEPRMIEALLAMQQLSPKPIVIANHPGRSAQGPDQYGLYDPAEFRDWNDTAPEIAVGMAGAPGHQAIAIAPDSSIKLGPRGGYGRYHTMGGFDPMTARVGGLWDSLLGEGRRWWITSNSDSHVHWREGGADFWPGEYSKTYVWAQKDYDDIIDGIRNGRVFVTLGDLVSELYVTAGESTHIGGELTIEKGDDVTVTIRFVDPETLNPWSQNPSVQRVDLIMGKVSGPAKKRDADSNKSTKVIARFTADDWTKDGDYTVITHTIKKVKSDSYIRVRGTNGEELEPEPDPTGEDPWADLWFYSNPIFITL